MCHISLSLGNKMNNYITLAMLREAMEDESFTIRVVGHQVYHTIYDEDNNVVNEYSYEFT